MVDPGAKAEAARLLAGEGHATAQCEYGHYLMDDQSIEVDLEEAARSSKPSADQGNCDRENGYRKALASNSARQFPFVFRKPRAIANCPPTKGIRMVRTVELHGHQRKIMDKRVITGDFRAIHQHNQLKMRVWPNGAEEEEAREKLKVQTAGSSEIPEVRRGKGLISIKLQVVGEMMNIGTIPNHFQ
jgi:TPR repeat protein